ncbi:hypothetical protein CV016_06070 [Yersinia kristensenii]|nr:hypothetical protein CV016_06070 [Yersinia kristensenii]
MRLTLRASIKTVQPGLRPICHSIAAFLRLELFRGYITYPASFFAKYHHGEYNDDKVPPTHAPQSQNSLN